MGAQLYGTGFPFKVAYPSMYGAAVLYAERARGETRYVGPVRSQPDPAGPQRYVDEVTQGRALPLDFIFYVPAGFGTLAGVALPNVEETTDPARLFTASFRGGQETWPASAGAPATAAA
jgi:hypothetical protein